MKYTENTNREAFVKKLESQNILTIIHNQTNPAISVGRLCVRRTLYFDEYE